MSKTTISLKRNQPGKPATSEHYHWGIHALKICIIYQDDKEAKAAHETRNDLLPPDILLSIFNCHPYWAVRAVTREQLAIPRFFLRIPGAANEPRNMHTTHDVSQSLFRILTSRVLLRQGFFVDWLRLVTDCKRLISTLTSPTTTISVLSFLLVCYGCR
jgi:hypothetical protein